MMWNALHLWKLLLFIAYFVNKTMLVFFVLQYVCSWDEWVPESRILKFTEASLQKQKELQKAHA